MLSLITFWLNMLLEKSMFQENVPNLPNSCGPCPYWGIHPHWHCHVNCDIGGLNLNQKTNNSYTHTQQFRTTTFLIEDKFKSLDIYTQKWQETLILFQGINQAVQNE